MTFRSSSETTVMRCAAILPLLLMLATSSCLSISWERHYQEKPVERQTVDGLLIGETNLDDCLAALGAPIFVDELNERMALTYGWGQSTAWNLSVDVSIVDDAASSVSYGSFRERMRGVVLIFDRAGILRVVRHGRLNDLRREFERQRPQSPPVIEG